MLLLKITYFAGNLTNLKTRSIIPVDLNAIMCWNAKLLAEFHEELHNVEKAHFYREVHARLMDAIEKVIFIIFQLYNINTEAIKINSLFG